MNLILNLKEKIQLYINKEKRGLISSNEALTSIIAIIDFSKGFASNLDEKHELFDIERSVMLLYCGTIEQKVEALGELKMLGIEAVIKNY